MVSVGMALILVSASMTLLKKSSKEFITNEIFYNMSNLVTFDDVIVILTYPLLVSTH